ncbi:MAG: RNA polymerase sigma factor [Ruminococcaceae bacterium]|nr:RNA polymerase sigma factor [Oscillospiraceae bacterium]
MTNHFLNEQCDTALQKIASGDMDALAVIYHKLGKRIFLLSLSILRDRESAEDIMQETFLKIAAEAHTYKEKSNAIAFILTITRNLSLNLLAKRRRSASYESSLDAGAEIADSNPTNAFSELPEALSLLDLDDRQIVILKLENNMKHRDIAAVLGISEAACQKRYRRALEKLKNYYIREGKR